MIVSPVAIRDIAMRAQEKSFAPFSGDYFPRQGSAENKRLRHLIINCAPNGRHEIVARAMDDTGSFAAGETPCVLLLRLNAIGVESSGIVPERCGILKMHMTKARSRAAKPHLAATRWEFGCPPRMAPILRSSTNGFPKAVALGVTQDCGEWRVEACAVGDSPIPPVAAHQTKHAVRLAPFGTVCRQRR